MTRTTGGLGEDARGGSGQLPRAGVYSATQRLEQIKAHQFSFVVEARRNWQGWLGSAVFHGALIILALAIGAQIIAKERAWEIWTDLQPGEEVQLSTESLDNLLGNNPNVDSEVEALPSVDADRDHPIPGYTDGATPGPLDAITSGGHLTGPPGDGEGGGRYLGGKFGGVLPGYQKMGLDLVFVFDSTGSMGGIILEVKTRIRELAKVMHYLVPSVRIGLVTYRDWKKYDLDDYEYTVKYLPLTKADADGINSLEAFLRTTEAYGGGDIPEAVQAGLEVALQKMGWNKTTKKVIIVFGDAPPHAEDNGLAKVYALCKDWHNKTGGIVSCIDTTGGSKLLNEFKEMGAVGGGEATFLNDDRAIIRQLVIQVFGSKWQKPLDEAIKTVLQGPEDTVIGQ